MAREGSETVIIREGGRVVIPASMRAALNLRPGDALLARIEGGELRLASRATRLRALQDKVRRYDRGSGPVVDEFLAARHGEAARE